MNTHEIFTLQLSAGRGVPMWQGRVNAENNWIILILLC